MERLNIEALQVGESVGISGQWSAAVLRVERRTKTQIILSDGSRWNLRGRKLGQVGWDASLCTVAEGRERINDLREQKAIREASQRLERFRWRDLNASQLGKFIAFLDEIEKEKTNVPTR